MGAVTGVHIDHFVEENLVGFYYLAQAFGGMEVCIEPAPAQGGFPAGANLTDIDTLVYPPTDNSGFNAYDDGYIRKKGGAQYLHLAADQALAFVRARDTIPGIDIGRTKRQQEERFLPAARRQQDHGEKRRQEDHPGPGAFDGRGGRLQRQRHARAGR